LQRINIIKKYLRTLLIASLAIGLLGVCFNLRGEFDKLHFPNISFGEQTYENVSNSLSSRERKTIYRSRNSTVKVYSMVTFDEPPYFSPAVATGTYVTYNNKFYILTAAHVGRNCETMMFITGIDEVAPCLRFVYYDFDLDISLIELGEELETKTPVKLNGHLNLSKNYSIGERIYYSGYPNDSALLTIKGHVSGYTYDNFLLQSYAWNGASGSGIFNLDGELIGVLSAIQVAYNGETYGLIDSIVYAIPIAEIDFTLID
tara:strand:+ start:1252 stop:2031 length:780 start_codon:yes stop_codon:yes gene_type:complete